MWDPGLLELIADDPVTDRPIERCGAALSVQRTASGPGIGRVRLDCAHQATTVPLMTIRLPNREALGFGCVVVDEPDAGRSDRPPVSDAEDVCGRSLCVVPFKLGIDTLLTDEDSPPDRKHGCQGADAAIGHRVVGPLADAVDDSGGIGVRADRAAHSLLGRGDLLRSGLGNAIGIHQPALSARGTGGHGIYLLISFCSVYSDNPLVYLRRDASVRMVDETTTAAGTDADSPNPVALSLAGGAVGTITCLKRGGLPGAITGGLVGGTVGYVTGAVTREESPVDIDAAENEPISIDPTESSSDAATAESATTHGDETDDDGPAASADDSEEADNGDTEEAGDDADGAADGDGAADDGDSDRIS